ncbi:MAG: hypothetical protein U9N83_04890 [Thermodesulfobacteriota bacterium]|nr:hypothetical protein [Thermodesulfobacteriota bacterium]
MLNIDGVVKSPKTVMPDLIRHPEAIEFYWIPAFAGMTKKGVFRLFTKPSMLKQSSHVILYIILVSLFLPNITATT